MDVFDLFAKITLDTSRYDEGLANASGMAINVGKQIVGAFVDAGQAIGSFAKQAVDAYSQYEQLAGGVETLFGSASDTVKENANKAFETVGISANKYMEQVTSFSASLIQSTGRGAQTNVEELEASLNEQYKQTKRHLEDVYDAAKNTMDAGQLKELKRQHEDQLEALKATNKELIAEAERMNETSVTTDESLAEAAQLADRAMIDMADNVNKMGTSMESIQNAYQGFAKQNYTMLDNLKLGYGGTKSEMERLIADASQLTDVQAKLGLTVDEGSLSFANIVKAISVMQESLGIAGTTVDESEKTISGSFSKVKAAWENLILAIGGGGPSIDEALDAVVVSAERWLQNIVPVFERALYGIANLISSVAPIIAERLPDLIAEIVPPLLNAIVTIIDSLAQELPYLIGEILPPLLDAVLDIVDSLIEVFPDLIRNIAEALISITPKLVSAFVDVLDLLMKSVLPMLFEVALKMVISLGEGLADNAEKLISGLLTLIDTIVKIFLDNLPTIIDVGLKLLLSLLVGLLTNMDKVADAIVTIIGSIIKTIFESLPEIIEMGLKIGLAIVAGIALAIPHLIVSIGRFLGIVKDAKEDVEKGTDNMTKYVDNGAKTVDDVLSDLTSDLGKTTKTVSNSTNQMTKVAKENADDASKQAQRIVNSAEAADKLANFALVNIEKGFTVALRDVQEFEDRIIDSINKCITKLEELGKMHVRPTVDASGVVDGCNRIIDAVDSAVKALERLAKTNVSSGGGFGGGHASGGWMKAGTTYLVGELGPELVTPTRSGYVHTAEETKNMLGSGGDIYITITGDVYDDERSMKRKLKNAILGVMQEQVSYG